MIFSSLLSFIGPIMSKLKLLVAVLAFVIIGFLAYKNKQLANNITVLEKNVEDITIARDAAEHQIVSLQAEYNEQVQKLSTYENNIKSIAIANDKMQKELDNYRKKLSAAKPEEVDAIVNSKMDSILKEFKK